MNAVIRYFDLFSGYRGVPAGYAAGAGEISVQRQFLIYLCLVLGVILGPYVPEALAGNSPVVSAMFLDANKIFWSFVLALVVFPGVYKIILDPGKPLFVQMGLALIAGFGAKQLAPFVIGEITKNLTSHAVPKTGQ
jgi:hypothetical protein